MKTAELLVGKNAAKDLAKNLVPAPIRVIYDAIDVIGQCSSSSDYNDKYDTFEKAYKAAESLGLLTDGERDQLKSRMEAEEAKLDFLNDDETTLNN